MASMFSHRETQPYDMSTKTIQGGLVPCDKHSFRFFSFLVLRHDKPDKLDSRDKRYFQTSSCEEKRVLKITFQSRNVYSREANENQKQRGNI